ncbi:conjugative transposon protein TraM [Hymenobacter sp. BT188]|uniref:conjugative transposon protein TraM n=1 Tax=Hymenobacter sp. BT188 TaxID=2763504 RepID=UPI0016514E0F|nr:conjugative transposon protein TraM [Hymenobacter sp. BT188]MBC6609229.1 conjugative transposon protein TraM [Hymenobacter sp. BT188]
MATPPPLTQEFINKRQLMAFIPVPTLLCFTLLFYLGGGGKGVAEAAAETGSGANGLNLSLPSAGPSTLFEDKLAAAKAPLDSSRQGLAFQPVGEEPPTPDALNYAVQPGQSAQRYDPNNDPNVTAVQSRLQQLQQQTAGQGEYSSYRKSNAEGTRSAGAPSYAPTSAPQDAQLEQSLRELDQLKHQYEQRLQAMNTPAASTTPAAKVPAPKARPKPSVVAAAPVSVVNRLDNTAPQPATQGNSFHSLGGTGTRPGGAAAINAVPAVVHSDQVVVQGQTVKLRLLSDVQLEGRVIPQNTVVYGVCHLSGQRLTIKVSSIQYENNLVPVSLSAYDLDGGEGLNIPGSVEREAAKQGLATGASSIDLLTMSPSIEAQAAGIAIQTGKALAGRKIKLVKINLKANYKLLLHE